MIEDFEGTKLLITNALDMRVLEVLNVRGDKQQFLNVAIKNYPYR